MAGWVDGQIAAPGKYGETIKKILVEVTGSPSEKFSLHDNIDNLLDNIYGKKEPNKHGEKPRKRSGGGGIEMFVQAAVKSIDLSDPTALKAVQDLAGSIFGDEVATNVVAQIVSLEIKLKNKPDIKQLSEELSKAGLALIDKKDNVINKLKELMVEDPIATKQKELMDEGSIASKQIIGGRAEQQDYVLTIDNIEKLPRGVKKIAFLADGHKKLGKKAAEMACKNFYKHFSEVLSADPQISQKDAAAKAIQMTEADLNKPYDPNDPNSGVRYNGKRKENQRETVNGKYVSDLEGGATFSAVIELENTILKVNVGDSRIYSVKPGERATVKQETKDQVTPIDEGGRTKNLLHGSLGDPDGKVPRNQNGAGMECIPEIEEIPKEPGMYFILASDGMYHKVGDQLSTVFSTKEEISANEAASQLISIAKGKDAEARYKSKHSDNSSVVVIKI